jgi:hypothetical protein
VSTHPFWQPWELQYAIYQWFFVGKILQLAMQKKEGVEGTKFFLQKMDTSCHIMKGKNLSHYI